MRLRRAKLQRRVNGSLQIEFGAEKLTSYSGLELLLRFVRQLRLRRRLRELGAFRKRVNHEPRKSKTVQLDLFNPDDGNWEYSVVATNKALGLAATWHFYNGRSIHEKTYAELKSGYAFETIPTNHYGANTAWQKLNVIAHNLATSFQLATTAEPRPRTRKRTACFLLRSSKTLRFEWLVKAARLVRPGGRRVLRLAKNKATQAAYAALDGTLSYEAG